MKFGTWLMIAAAGCWPALAQQSNPPQRTITNRPDSTVSSDAKPASSGTPTNPAAALEQYRQAWQKMTPAQQKAIVSAGGPTPEQYERMLTQRGTGAKGANLPATDPRAADSGALDALSKSLQDLNAVRDANLSLVQKDGCAPELASRIADLKAKLRSDEFELNGTEAPAAPPTDAHTPEKVNAANAADPMAVASDWFKHPADPKPTARPDDSSRTREASLLDSVLTGTQAPVAPERRFDPKSPEAEQNRKAIEADMARVKSELEQLSSACAAAKR
ncbi:MAG TPA: hypothetical protein VK335_26965 [Bryobacteraceae bacterium]|nr:hypothetical protein [Bryobacteraceae bacterium]